MIPVISKKLTCACGTPLPIIRPEFGGGSERRDEPTPRANSFRPGIEAVEECGAILDEGAVRFRREEDATTDADGRDSFGADEVEEPGGIRDDAPGHDGLVGDIIDGINERDGRTATGGPAREG